MRSTRRVQTTQSMRSLRSVKSRSMYDIPADEILDLDEMVNMATQKFEMPCPIVVKKDLQKDNYYKSLKGGDKSAKKKISLISANVGAPALNPRVAEKDDKTEETASESSDIDDQVLVITGMYDNMDNLMEILLLKCKQMPRVVMKILGILIPQFMQLKKMTIKRCKIDPYTIYELHKFLPMTSITELCLDGSPLLEGNYALLLDNRCRLNTLSLSACMINDEVCEQIVSKLHFTQPAETTLSVLNLSSNHITDVGARYIGEALRTNRHLRYLNLAGNQIDDEGADRIFHALTKFALTYDEIMTKRRRYMDYLKYKQSIYSRYISEWDTASMDEYSLISKKSATRKSSIKKEKHKIKSATTDEMIQLRAEMVANELIGPFVNPFTKMFTIFENNYEYCIGNMRLCYLNLSYNKLSYLSVKKLRTVLLYQSINKMMNETGLVKVVLDGNPLPVACAELDQVSDLLQKNVIKLSGRFVDRRKSLARGRLSIAPEKQK